MLFTKQKVLVIHEENCTFLKCKLTIAVAFVKYSADSAGRMAHLISESFPLAVKFNNLT